MTNQKITDGSEDKKYFFLTPQIVWARSRDPYDFTLWNVIKMVAGELGECFLSTDQLAALGMMSAGKVSDSRQYLMQQGLLKGELRQDPGYPQPVWHLQIPNLWKINLEWREQLNDLRQRIELKRRQKSLHQVKPSPGEEGVTPGEEGLPPGETKKNHKEEPKGEPSSPASEFLPSGDGNDLPDADTQTGILFAGGTAGEDLDEAEQKLLRGSWAIHDRRLKDACIYFLSATKWEVPPPDRRKGGARKDWEISFQEHLDRFSLTSLEELYKEALRRRVASHHENPKYPLPTRPGALTPTMEAIWKEWEEAKTKSPSPHYQVVQREMPPIDWEAYLQAEVERSRAMKAEREATEAERRKRRQAANLEPRLIEADEF